ncbi:ankyrin repeat domain-containing protein 26 [Manis pentadactyla]|uniref:ankyrin repeat domain-containing protein 26 n=1 Tax=Manis pentadactyla TaxID=143292 RepID=UPI00255C5554|nr:ankyrin repeat domain-containing protein 26 [Manis pentadactyla]
MLLIVVKEQDLEITSVEEESPDGSEYNHLQVIVRQLQQQRDDTVIQQPNLEALLEVTSYCCTNVQDKTWYLRKKLNKFISQVEPAPQEKLEHLREHDDASCGRQMELRIKDLESQLSKKNSQEDSIKTELEKYKQFYLEE